MPRLLLSLLALAALAAPAHAITIPAAVPRTCQASLVDGAGTASPK